MGEGVVAVGSDENNVMLYQAYQAHTDFMGPVRTLAASALKAIGQPLPEITGTSTLRNLTAAYELIARAGLTHVRPPFGIEQIKVGNRDVQVREEFAEERPHMREAG